MLLLWVLKIFFTDEETARPHLNTEPIADLRTQPARAVRLRRPQMCGGMNRRHRPSGQRAEAAAGWACTGGGHAERRRAVRGNERGPKAARERECEERGRARRRSPRPDQTAAAAAHWPPPSTDGTAPPSTDGTAPPTETRTHQDKSQRSETRAQARNKTTQPPQPTRPKGRELKTPKATRPRASPPKEALCHHGHRNDDSPDESHIARRTPYLT